MKRFVSLAVVLVSLTTATSALAQLEEVIVTATKRVESLQDIPVSVTALSETTLQEAGVENIEDVAQLVPSLTVTVNLNPFARVFGFAALVHSRMIRHWKHRSP
jgi:outer membrane receptor protein involved in Fe transport